MKLHLCKLRKGKINKFLRMIIQKGVAGGAGGLLQFCFTYVDLCMYFLLDVCHAIVIYSAPGIIVLNSWVCVHHSQLIFALILSLFSLLYSISQCGSAPTANQNIVKGHTAHLAIN